MKRSELVMGRGSIALCAVLVALSGLRSTSNAQEISDALRLSSRAQTYNAPALGMGNAYSTIGYDFTGVVANPATTGLIERWQLTASLNTNVFPGTSRLGGTDQYFSTWNTSMNQFGVSAPIGGDSGKVVFSLGYTQSRDFNQSLKYGGYNPANTSIIQTFTGNNREITRRLGLSTAQFDSSAGLPLNDATVINGQMTESGFILDAGSIVHFSFGVAGKVLPGIYIGGAASYAIGTYRSDREYTEIDSDNRYDETILTNPSDPRTADFQSAYIRDVRDVEYRGWDFRFGLLYKLENFIGISGAFKVAAPYSVNEIRSEGGWSGFAGDTIRVVEPIYSSSFYKVIPAYEATVGAMVNLWILTGTLEATYIDYTQIDYTSGVSLEDRGTATKRIKSELTPVINLNGGAEFRLPWTGIVARAGFMYMPSPVKNDPMEFDTKVITAGVGINSSDRVRVDVGYALGFWTQRGSQYGLTNLTQDVETHDVLVSVRFAF